MWPPHASTAEVVVAVKYTRMDVVLVVSRVPEME